MYYRYCRYKHYYKLQRRVSLKCMAQDCTDHKKVTDSLEIPFMTVDKLLIKYHEAVDTQLKTRSRQT